MVLISILHSVTLRIITSFIFTCNPNKYSVVWWTMFWTANIVICVPIPADYDVFINMIGELGSLCVHKQDRGHWGHGLFISWIEGSGVMVCS